MGEPPPGGEPVQHGIQTRIAILVLLAALAPTVILGGAVLAGLGELKTRLFEARLAVAQGLARRVDHHVRDVLELLASVPSDNWASDLASGGEPQRDALRVVRVRAQLVSRTFLVDARWEVVLEEPTGAEAGLDVTRFLVQGGWIEAGRPTIVPLANAGPGRSTLLAVVPLRGNSGAILGAAAAVLDPASERWASTLKPLLPSPAVSAAVVDREGRVLAASPPRPGFPPIEDRDRVAPIVVARGAEVVVGARDAGIRRVTAIAPMSVVPWSCVLVEPEETLLAPIARLRRFILTTAPVLAILTALFAWGIARSVKKPLAVLGGAAGRIAAGDLRHPVPDLGVDEIGVLGRNFEAMRLALGSSVDELQRANQEMERRVDDRTRELRGLYNELRLKDEQRSRLLRKVIGAQEDERKRIARELHDESCQTVAALKMMLDSAAEDTPAPELLRTLGEARSLAARSLDEMHRLMFALRPPVLDDLGLASAVRWLAQRDFPPRGIRLHMDLDDAAGRMPFEVEIAVFRAVQEALSNVLRHANAESVWIRIAEANAVLEAEIEDDGVGFSPADVATPSASGRGLGILGMRERLDLVGGTVDVESSPSGGTRVLMRVPLDKEAPIAG